MNHEKEVLSENRQGVAIVLLNEQHQVWLGKRKNSYRAGDYGLPGGRVEPGESLADAAARELEEETGISGQLLLPVGQIVDHQDGKEMPFIHHIFTCITSVIPETREPDKCEGWRPFSIHQLPPDLMAGHRQAIQLVTI